MTDRLRPCLNDISFAWGMLNEPEVQLLEDEPFRALMALIAHVANSQVWTMTEPMDGRIPNDDVKLARITRLSAARWERVRPQIASFFKVDRRTWTFDRNWIRIGEEGTKRPAIPAALRSAVLQRDQFTCCYCGDTNGPFHCDHIVAVARGGATSIENLITACGPCNLSKGEKSIEEWIRARTLASVFRRETT